MAHIRERDGHRCRVCGVAQNLHVHHILFRSQGGPDEDWNLITLCSSCHDVAHGLRKGRSLPKWELHSLAMGLRGGHCVTCKYLVHDGCEIWEETVSWDYWCNAWSRRLE